MIGLLRLSPLLLSLLALGACPSGDDEKIDEPDPREWPPEFEAFAFSRDTLVLFPFTCEVTGFRMEVPGYGAEDIEIEVTNGPTRIDDFDHAEELGVYTFSLRACTREDYAGEDEEGRIRVSFKDHPDYYVELRAPRREAVEALETSPPLFALDLGGHSPVDVRFTDDGLGVEVASASGLVSRWSLEELAVEAVRFGREGTKTIVDEARLIDLDEPFRRVNVIDTDRQALLATYAGLSMQNWSNPGDATLAHSAGGTIAIGGEHPLLLGCFVAALDGRGGYYSLVMQGEFGGDYAESRRDAHLEHVVVSPDGRTVASRIVGCTASIGEPGLFDMISETSCRLNVLGGVDPYLATDPVFSNDSLWYVDKGLNVFNVPACARRASGPGDHVVASASASAIAISNGGHLLAVNEGSRIRLFDVPETFGGTSTFREDLAPFPAAQLRFSDDGKTLYALRSDAIRAYDLEAGTYRETPLFDGTNASLQGVHLHVPALGGEDVIYALDFTPRLVARLPEGAVFLGIDDLRRAHYELASEHYRLDLTSGGTEALGATPPTFTPAAPSPSLSLEASASSVVVERI